MGKSKIKITFKMHGFQPHNMFHMVNTMMNDPEFKNLAKNFEEQMKNSMEEFKKSQTKETQKPTESSCSSSSPKTTENSCSEQKTQNSSACPMFKMCNPRKNNEKSNRNGQRKTTIMIEETCQLPGYLVDNDLLKT